MEPHAAHKTAAAGAARRKREESKTAARGVFSSSLDDAATASPAPFPHAAGLLPFTVSSRSLARSQNRPL